MKVSRMQQLSLYVGLALVFGSTLSAPNVLATNAGDAKEAHTIVVTATRSEQQLSEVPASVGVVTGDDIRERHATNMNEALNIVPGVDINTYGGGVGYTNSNAFRINGSDQVLYLVDGINMGAAGVNPPMTILKDMSSIDRVEVQRGAGSTLYGSGAIGGVVNVITAKPEQGVQTKLRVMGGSNDLEQYAITNEGSKNDWYWRVGLQKDIIGSYKDGHGVRIPQHGNSHTASFMVGNKINDKNDVKISYDTYRGDVMYSDHLGALNHIRYGNEANDSLRAIWNNKISNRWSHQLYLMNNHYKTTYDGYLTDVKTRGIGDQVTYKAKDHTVVGGFDWRQDKVVNMGGVKLTNASYFIQDEWKFAPKWTVTPGIRIDHHSSFGTHTSPSISLGYDVNAKTNVYAAYKEYFLAPTPYQLFDGFNGNRNLKPETGHEFDLGVHHKFGKTWNSNLSFFSRSTKDKIGWVMTNPAAFTGQYRNFDTEKAHGINADVRKQLTKHLSARLGYTYTHIDATPTRKANRDGYVPKHAVNAGLDYNDAKWDAHLDIRGIINRPGTADNVFPRKTYWLADISANYRVRENVTVFGRINNIFDTYYAEQSSVRWGNPGDWWPGQGRNFRLGLEVTI